MNIFTRIKNTISSYLPGNRNPNWYSPYSQFMSQYGWASRAANKPQGDFEVYYEAIKNVYVFRCIQVEIDTLLGTGFQINKLNDESVDIARRNYLTNLFNNPEGWRSEITYAMFHSQYIRSFEGTGDAFIEANHEKLFNDENVLTGFRHIPPELLTYYPDTDQWGYRTNPEIRYEPSELIHIHEPNIQLRGSKWGLCKIDNIALAIALLFQSMKHNKNIMDNDGLDPHAIISYPLEMDDNQFMNEMNRLSLSAKEKRNGGTLALKGGTFTSPGNIAKDMDWTSLMTLCRDMIIIGYGVPPAMVGIIETANLGSGSGDSQKRTYKDTLSGRASIIEGAFNKALGHNGFEEVFQFNELDTEDKKNRAEIENIRLQNGSLSINEVRSGYGEEPVPWGNVPMNYSNYGVTPNILNPTNVEPLGTADIDKALQTVQAYKSKLYSSDLIQYNEW